MTGDDNHDGDQPKTSNPSPPVLPPTQQIPHIVSSIKLPILKKGKYDIWAMKMEHYLSHTDYPIWKSPPPKTAEEVVARERERKARTTLLMALPEDHLAKFHKMADAKEMWEAIKSRFGGNDESKKMQKYLLKQQFKGFSVSASEGLHKGYDRFQTLLSQLEIHGAGVSHEDANQKFLRSLPSSWSQVALIMITKPGLDTLSFDDLYNNLRVFERGVKGTTASSSNTKNVAFVSTDNTSSTNDVSTAYSVSFPSVSKSQKEGSLSYTDEVIHSFFANQSSAPKLDYDDLDQITDDGMEEMELKWHVAMISMRIKKFHNRTGRKLLFDTKDPVGFDKTKVECFHFYKIGHFARDCRAKGNQDSRRKDVGYNGNKDRDNDAQNYDMMAYSSSNSGSDDSTNSTVGPSRAFHDVESSYPNDPSMPHLEDIYASLSEGIFTDSSYDEEGVVTNFNNLETTINVSPTPTARKYTIHPKIQILRDPMSAVQTRSKVNKNSKARALIKVGLMLCKRNCCSSRYIRYVDLPFEKKAIKNKWVYWNKKDERGVIVRNKARLVAQGHRQDEGIDYDEVFAHVARIEAIRILLAFASYMGFIVYQIDVKSAFMYDTIDEEIYVTQPPSFVDPKFPNKVYKVVKALYGLHQAPKAWFQMSSMGELTFFLGLHVKQKEDNIFINQDKYVAEILKKFDFLSVKTASTLIETQKPLAKDEEVADVDVHLYRLLPRLHTFKL
uniref:Reverse transcriptase Ty1/copia-type domain-containing protein n=1 Tax=Tanacetum cinerariifolium TaxID=118510 RepID=A0A699IXD5_TANCI|nr:hypothetical protein [Tanacetum cinerariifolium]